VTTRALGIASVILLVQFFFYIPSVIGTNLIDANWATYQPGFLLYILLNVIAIVILAVDKSGRDIVEGSIPNFLTGFGGTAIAMWAILTVVAIAFGEHVVATTFGVARVPVIVYTLVYVAPTEELMFREVLPRVIAPLKKTKGKRTGDFSWVGVAVSSAFLFPAFHVWTYAQSAGGVGGALLAALVTASMAGVILALIYKYFGYGSCTAAHGWYDLFVTGAISGLALTGTAAFWLKPF